MATNCIALTLSNTNQTCATIFIDLRSTIGNTCVDVDGVFSMQTKAHKHPLVTPLFGTLSYDLIGRVVSMLPPRQVYRVWCIEFLKSSALLRPALDLFIDAEYNNLVRGFYTFHVHVPCKTSLSDMVTEQTTQGAAYTTRRCVVTTNDIRGTLVFKLQPYEDFWDVVQTHVVTLPTDDLNAVTHVYRLSKINCNMDLRLYSNNVAIRNGLSYCCLPTTILNNTASHVGILPCLNIVIRGPILFVKVLESMRRGSRSSQQPTYAIRRNSPFTAELAKLAAQ